VLGLSISVVTQNKNSSQSEGSTVTKCDRCLEGAGFARHSGRTRKVCSVQIRTDVPSIQVTVTENPYHLYMYGVNTILKVVRSPETVPLRFMGGRKIYFLSIGTTLSGTTLSKRLGVRRYDRIDSRELDPILAISSTESSSAVLFRPHILRYR